MKTINNNIEVNYKQGQTWYFVGGSEIKRYEYLCPFPTHNPVNLGKYDIIIWKNLNEPEKIYRETLVELVEKNKHITSYEEAKVELLKQAKEHLIALQRIYAKGA
jgi:hypothetical protein